MLHPGRTKPRPQFWVAAALDPRMLLGEDLTTLLGSLLPQHGPVEVILSSNTFPITSSSGLTQDCEEQPHREPGGGTSNLRGSALLHPFGLCMEVTGDCPDMEKRWIRLGEWGYRLERG